MATTPGSGPDLRALLKDAYLSVEKLKARVEALEREKSEPIAVVGLGCRFPGGVDSPDAFWQLLRDGVDAIREVPADRWDVDAWYDPNPDAPDKMYTRWGGFLEGVDGFDPSFFGISRREAAAMDPQQRLVLEVAWEALEHGGIRPDGLAGSAAGVFLGISTCDYAKIVASSIKGPAMDLYAGTGNSFSIASGRLSYVLGLQGPSLSVDTACSASLLAVHLAVESLRRKECSVALAGGVNLMFAPALTAVMCRGRMLSFDGRCKTFDAAADGYVRGEGCGVVVLRRLSDAQAAGDRVLAVVRGSAVNQDGRSSGLTAPNGLAQEALLRAALKSAGVTPAQVGYVEAHGTGTSLGDPIEMRALGAVMGDGRPADRPLLVGAVKTNIGHLESAAGVASFIKAVLSLHHGEVPPHLHLRKPNPHIAWDEMPVRVATARQPMPEADGRRIAGVSSFGFSGTNVHVILEAAPAPSFARSAPDRPLHVLPLSARSAAALADAASRVAAACESTALDLRDVAHTAASGRSHFRHRLAVVGRESAGVAAQLRRLADGEPPPGVVQGVAPDQGAPKVAFLFTGQGSQYVEMGRELYDTAPAFRRTLDRCDELLRPHLGGESIVAVLYGDGDAAAREARLADTRLTQPALFALEYAIAELWLSWGIKPLAVMGHSLGEYVAACVAGVFSLEDALALVAARAALMSALPGGGEMAAVLAPEAAVREAIAPFAASVSVAAVNGPESVVISGRGAEVRAAAARLAERGVRSTPLAVSHAFHSPLMAPMLDAFGEAARRVAYKAPRIRVVSNVTGRAAEADEITRPEYWRRHIEQPVLFAPSVAWLHAQGFRVFLEVGPQATLAGMAARCVADPAAAWLPSLRRAGQDWEQMLRSLAELYVRGVDVDWAAFDRDYARQRVTLPTYPFERQRCWMDVRVAPRPAAAAQGERANRLADWLYEVAWQPAEPGAAAAPASGSWLIFADRGGYGAALAAALEAGGASCRVVAVEAGLDARAAIDEARRGGALTGIVHLSGLDVETSALDGAGLAQAEEATCGSLLALVQALAAGTDTPPRLYVVTRGAVTVGGAPTGPLPRVAQAPLWGLARVIALEHAELRVTAIDVDPEQPSPERLHAELLAPGDENQVAFRGGTRYVARLVRHPAAAPADAGPLPAASLRPDATYLVTGGAGALGLKVAQLLAASGARHLVVTGRSTPSPQAATVFDALRAAGTSVTVSRCDVAHEADLRRVLEEIAASGFPLRGIVHAAGVLDDGVLTEQTAARFRAVMAPKVRGSWLLHRLTERERLDFFVLFSSSAAVLGSPGQGNYAAANAFMDALAHYRRAAGQPAVSVSWGAWGDAGMAVRLTGREQGRLADRGIDLISPEDGMRVLGMLLRAAPPHVLAAPVRWAALLPALAGRMPPILRTIMEHASGRATGPAPGEMPGYMRRSIADAPEAEREAMLAAFVRAQVARVLGEDASTIDHHASFDALGFDSLMVVELRNALAVALACDVPPSAFYDRATVDTLVTVLAQRIRDGHAPVPVAAAASRDGDPQAAAALLTSLDRLSDDRVDALLQAMLAEQGTRDE